MPRENKPKSKCCNAEIKVETGWIEHGSIGHPGGIVCFCSKCGERLDFWETQKLIGYYYEKSQNLNAKRK